jgi:hypothetical protein
VVDDLLVFTREPDKVIDPLQKVFMYELTKVLELLSVAAELM